MDVHCHVGQKRRPAEPGERFSFEPAGPAKDGNGQPSAPGAPAWDAYLSDRLTGGLSFRLARWWLGISSGSDRETDEGIERLLLHHILGACQLERAVALAFDEYHTNEGEALGPRARRAGRGTDLYVSNTYVRQLWRRYPRRILFGASIHPYRQSANQTALDMLEEVTAAGAVLIKWLPLAQNISGRDPRTIAFLRRAAELRMPMLIHYGGEKCLGNAHPEFEDPAPLLQTLRGLRAEGGMPTVIVAHVATPALWPLESGRYFRALITALLGEFSDAPLYADISALALPQRARWLKKLARTPAVHRKLVYGSDFPLPAVTWCFRRELGRLRRAIGSLESWLDRDIMLKSALGFGEDVFLRAGKLLRHRIQIADALVADGRRERQRSVAEPDPTH